MADDNPITLYERRHIRASEAPAYEAVGWKVSPHPDYRRGDTMMLAERLVREAVA